MISSYKFKIILWYTSLFTAILLGVFILIYLILGYQLQHEVDCKVIKKAEWMNSVLTEIKKPPQDKQDFFRSITSQKHPNFYDIREYTDIADHKFILFIFREDSLMYLTTRYHNYSNLIDNYPGQHMSLFKMQLNSTPFTIIKIHKEGYSAFLGYQITTIYSVKSKLFQLLVIILPLGILLSILCGLFVTQRSLNIINQINKTTQSITSKNLHKRIHVPQGNDEIGELIVTLNSMIDRLDKSFTMIKQFSQDAAHELRTPLTIIRGEVEELLTYEKIPNKVSNSLESILEEIQYLISISNTLMLLHSIDTGKIDYNFIKIDLSTIVSDTYEDASILVSEKNQKIVLRQNDKVKINGNEELLTRLLWNLIDNSVKYTPEESIITIELKKKNKHATITVQDNGFGIPEDDIPRIFERFYRVDKSRSRKLGGSGLGLSICKWIVELHEGTIQVKSKLNKGTKVIVEFPIIKD
ncbi:MAG: HAMP domain-containing sensor histidine kinase [bacterium]